jgi:hypothetical protein
MIASTKRLGRSPKPTRKEVVRRTWPLSVRQEREKERVQPHNQGRRRT